MSLIQSVHFLLEVFQMTDIALVSVLNHYHLAVLADDREKIKQKDKQILGPC